jgi:endonuclease/exonuclease/phosphatase family metal-dependent hydrolase
MNLYNENLNKYNIYSFNILNPKSFFMTLDKIPYNENKNTKKIIAKELSLINNRRADYRNTLLFYIIDSLLNKDNTIICLQEVDINFLDTLKDIYKDKLAHKKNNDIVVRYEKKIKISTETDDDYRVTLISKNLQFIDSFDIELAVMSKGNKQSTRNALYTKIHNINNNNIIQCINLHIHHSSKEADYMNYSKMIKYIIIQNSNKINDVESMNNLIPFIIAGDFNKPILDKSIISFLDILSEINVKTQIAIAKNSLPEKQFTSFNTRNNPINGIKLYDNNDTIKLSVIDHIIIGGNFSFIDEPQILHQIDNKNIFYNMKKIKTNILGNDYNKIVNYSKKIKSGVKKENIVKNYSIHGLTEKWISDRSGKNISDHVPIYASIVLI